MIPAYRRSVSSLMPLDLNQDQNHELLFSPNHHSSSSSSPFSSLSYPILFNSPDQNQEGSHYCEPKQLPNIHEEAEKTIPCSGSCAETEKQCESRKVRVWKKEENHEATTEDGSLKWMSSKMRMMRKMMVSDQGNSMQQNDQDNSSSSNNYYSNNTTVRVCADCHTTKTPLWRSGPRGPKSLCNACGIRQRKARRAMAAAASANGTILMATETSVKRNKLQKKEKKNKSKIESPQHMKKKHNLEAKAKPSKSKKKFGFEDLTLRLSKNLALQKVFPQDEKEAAILLMALSYGLVHG